MRLAEISLDDLISQARAKGIGLRYGPFNVRLRTDIPELIEWQQKLYGRMPVVPVDGLFEFRIDVSRVRGPRRWYRPQARFLLEGHPFFDPFPRDHALPLFEWGLNWCIGSYAHQYLMLHAGVVARDDQALILPALPGSGKSTLTAALMARGWRLLTDEIGLVRLEGGLIQPLGRAIALKNESIAVMDEFAPRLQRGPLFPKTRKGTVAHLGPTLVSQEQQDRPAKPRWMIFPRFRSGAKFSLQPESKSRSFIRQAHNSFNYEALGKAGYLALGRLIEQCDCYVDQHDDLDAAVAGIEAMVEQSDASDSANSA